MEYSVVVSHEGVAQDPELAAGGIVRGDAANAIGGVCRDWTKVQALCHGEVPAGESEGYNGERGVARENVESSADGGGSVLRTGNLCIDGRNAGGITDYERSSLYETVSESTATGK
jgi:hypothetical protein